jgi:hypothetical protein
MDLQKILNIFEEHGFNENNCSFFRQEDITDIAKEIKAAINYTHSCTQLLCLDDDFNFLTKNKTYEMVSEPDGHYVVIDDFGEERLLWKKYFKILN